MKTHKFMLFLIVFLLTFVAASATFIKINENFIDMEAEQSNLTINSSEETALQIANRNAAIIRESLAEINAINKNAQMLDSIVRMALAGSKGAQRILSKMSKEYRQPSFYFDEETNQNYPAQRSKITLEKQKNSYELLIDEHRKKGNLTTFESNLYESARKSAITNDVFEPPSRNYGAVNPQTGEYYAPSGTGYVGTRDGTYYSPAGPNGVIDTRTGQFIPNN